MADTAIAISAGSGTNVDTRTEATNGNHRQVVVLGDPSTNAGVAPVDATAGLKVDLGADNDISGTVTANLSATDNAVLDTIDTNTGSIKTAVELIDNAVSGAGFNITQLGGAAVPIGAGLEATAIRVTLPTDSTGVVSVDDNGGALTVDGTVTANLSATDNAVLDNIQTSVDTVAAAVSTEMQVDVVAALPAGTNAIGKLAANSGVDIGDVTLTAGTAAIGTLLPPDIDVTTHTNYVKKYYTSTGAATDGIIWSPAAGKRWHVVSMYLQTSAAATITLEDDKTGGDEAIWKGEFAANQGMTIHWGEKYPLASGEDAADLMVTTTAGNIYITVTGYEI